MSSYYTAVNNNYIIVSNIFNDCIINLCGFRFFWDALYPKGLFIWDEVFPVSKKTFRQVYKRDLAFLRK